MKRLTIAILLGASLAAFGCSRQEQAEKPDVSAADVRKEAKEAAGAAAQYVDQQKDEFLRTAQSELDQLKDQLASLNSQAQAASGDAQAALQAQVAKLEAQWKAAEARLAALKATSAEKWQEAKANFAKEMEALQQAFKQDGEDRNKG